MKRLAWLVVLMMAGVGVAGAQDLTIASGGVERRYVLHLPASRDGATPLVLLLHGAGGNARDALRSYRWDRMADREGFAVAAAQGLPARPDGRSSLMLNPNVWNDGSARFSAARREIDDVVFLAAVLDDVARRTPIDPLRVYVTGFSNGAAMTFLVAARLPQRFAAAAPVSSHWWQPMPQLARGVPLLFIVGDRDPLNPYDGGEGRNPWGRPQPRPAFIRSAEAWAAAIGCRAGPIASRDLPPSLIRWTECRDGAAVTMRTIRGLGHTWPGGVNRLPERVVGPHLPQPDATALIWAFFRDQVRR
jgi:polyhydroxybutyrate depolymerase